TFRTQRIERDAIVAVDIVALNMWSAFVLNGLFGLDVGSSLRLTLADGTRRVIETTTSDREDVEAEADIVRAWARGSSANPYEAERTHAGARSRTSTRSVGSPGVTRCSMDDDTAGLPRP